MRCIHKANKRTSPSGEIRPLMTPNFGKRAIKGFVNVYETSPFRYLSNAFV